MRVTAWIARNSGALVLRPPPQWAIDRGMSLLPNGEVPYNECAWLKDAEKEAFLNGLERPVRKDLEYGWVVALDLSVEHEVRYFE